MLKTEAHICEKKTSGFVTLWKMGSKVGNQGEFLSTIRKIPFCRKSIFLIIPLKNSLKKAKQGHESELKILIQRCNNLVCEY